MADIYAIQECMGGSIRYLRKLEKNGFLNSDKATDPAYGQVVLALRNLNPLAVKHLLYLMRNPGMINRLGRFEESARDQIAALGQVAGESAPIDLACELPDAAARKPEAVEAIAQWTSALIGCSPYFDHGQEQSHAFIAVRLLYNVPDDLLKFNLPAVAKALFNARRHGMLHGYSRVDATSRKTFYFRPTGFDL